MTFIPNKYFRRDYDHLFKDNPLTANMFLLLCELADENGQVCIEGCFEEEIERLMVARFNDPEAYQLLEVSN